MKIALMSVKSIEGDTLQNLKTIEAAMYEHTGAGISMICFGASFLQGAVEAKPDYESAPTGALQSSCEEIGKIKSLCRIMAMGVSFGYSELFEGRVYNSYITIDDMGLAVSNHRRIPKALGLDIYGASSIELSTSFSPFFYHGKRFLTGLSGDFLDETSVYSARMTLPDLVLLADSISCGTSEWNYIVRDEIVSLASNLGGDMIFVNALFSSAAPDGGGAMLISDGTVLEELPYGQTGSLILTF